MPTSPLTFSPPIIACRGACSGAPENSLAAFRLAHEQGAVWVETDVKLTQDGIPVLMHDDTLDRTTDGKGPIADTEWAVVKTLDNGSWFGPQFARERVPRLSEALHFVLSHDMRINIEIKPCPGRTQATVMVAMMEAYKIWPENALPPLISSFDIEALTIAAQMHPQWPRGLLLNVWREDWAEMVGKTSVSVISVNEDLLTAERIAQLREARLPILAHTVNDTARAKELLGWGVEAIFSHRPEDLIKAL